MKGNLKIRTLFRVTRLLCVSVGSAEGWCSITPIDILKEEDKFINQI